MLHQIVTTILYWFWSPKTLLNTPVNGKIQGLFNAFQCFLSTFQGKFYFQGLFKTVLYIQVLFKPVQTLVSKGTILLNYIEFGSVVQMVFKRYLIWSSGSPLVQWSRTISAILKGHHGNIHVKLYEIWTCGSGGNVVWRHFLSKTLAVPLFSGLEPFAILEEGTTLWNYFEFGPVVQEEEPFKGVSYSELWQPICSAERDHLCNFCRGY